MRRLPGALSSRRRSYERALAPQGCGCSSPDAGLGDIWSDLTGIVDQKTRRLETALWTIIGLSGVAALTGVFGLLRKR